MRKYSDIKEQEIEQEIPVKEEQVPVKEEEQQEEKPEIPAEALKAYEEGYKRGFELGKQLLKESHLKEVSEETEEVPAKDGEPISEEKEETK